MVFDLFSMLNKIVVVVIPYPGQKVYKYIYSAIPKRPLIWHYTVPEDRTNYHVPYCSRY